MTITAYSVGGTWGTWDDGFGADTCRAVAADPWDIIEAELLGTDIDFVRQGVAYPGSFGPVGGPADAPSYAESVKRGVAEHIRLINTIPGKFITAGYSQGAELVRRVQYELAFGSLRHRRDDCLRVITFGDPACQPGEQIGDNISGWGISGFVMPPNPIPVHCYATRGDMYCTTPGGESGENMRAVYRALTNLQIPLTGDLLSALIGNPGLVAQLIDLVTNPIGGIPALIDSIRRLIDFAITGAHGNYAWAVDAAVADLRALAKTTY
ncbi:PE-PPE domain-containing protein [Mycolicibacterium mageritense]|uniref:PE-PPE domain-containing protein n=1 Tax=Mycolicibacterium mageritense TaxID=53462 RepID=UPI001E619455|nr:PE-PPE domain-containing protein [Mycolicibacterium mageritense]MCC9182553.1 PE-PPE domain-containing protein [Mycolicibacterium mageritense]